MSKKPNTLSRRDFLNIAVKGTALTTVGLFLQSCKGILGNSINALSVPTVAALKPPTPPPAEATKQPNSLLIEQLQANGIRIEKPNSGWPTTYQEVADALAGSDPDHQLTADKVTAIIETDPDGSKVWRGWYMAEPAFPLKEGIVFNPVFGVHVRQTTNETVFDPTEIFEADWSKLPQDVKDNFAKRLVDIRINNNPNIAVFARRGGITREELPKNTHYFTGTVGTQVQAIEQLSLIPVPEDLCPDDIRLSAVTRAFRQAAVEFRDNPDARDGKITVEWYEPENKEFKQLDGRLIAKLKKDGFDLSVLEKLPANTPLSPEEMARQFGGRPENWVVNPNTWEWFYEAFALQPGVKYITGVGHVGAYGKLLVRNVDGDLNNIFNFKILDRKALTPELKAPGHITAVLFVRVGETTTDPKYRNHSWYTWGHGDVTLSQPLIEQATFMIVNLNSCPTDDWSNVVRNRAITLATEKKDPKITALYWDEDKKEFIDARK